MIRKKRIGIYGGAFDPPHAGHVAAAREFVHELGLDLLYVVPNLFLLGRPAHGANAEHRLNMCRAAFENVPACVVSDIEIRRGEESYTYITVEALATPDAELFLLCGSDVLTNIEHWREIGRILDLCTVCCIKRNAATDCAVQVDRLRKEYGANVIFLSTSSVDASSTDIRRRIASGESVSRVLDIAVERYISAKGLYK